MKAVLDCHGWKILECSESHHIKKFQYKIHFFARQVQSFRKMNWQITKKIENFQPVKANRLLIALGVFSSFKCFVVYLRIFICFSEKSLSCCRMIWTQPLISMKEPEKKESYMISILQSCIFVNLISILVFLLQMLHIQIIVFLLQMQSSFNNLISRT